MASIDSCFASPMKAQELIRITSASRASSTSRYPSSSRLPSMTSLSTRFFGQPSESRYSEGCAGRAVLFIGAAKGPYNRPRPGIQPARVRLSATAYRARLPKLSYFAAAAPFDDRRPEPSVPKILESQIHLQLVLLAAHHLDHCLQIVAALAGDADGVALDRSLDLELAVLDRLDDRLRFLRLDPLHEAEHLRDVLSALLEGSVLEPAQRDAALGHLLHQHRARGLQALLRGAADLQPLLRRGDLLQRGLRPLEVVPLIDLLAGLLERVVHFLLVHLADDVEARHVTSPGRPATPSAVSPDPSSRRSGRRGGGPLPPFRDRCAGRERSRRARRAPPGAPAPAAIRRGRRRLFPRAPARAPPRRSCDPGRRGRPACRSRREAGGPAARPRRRRRNRPARRGTAGPRTPRSGPPRRSRPCAAPPRRHPPRSRRPGDSRPPPPRCARALRACGTRRGWGRSCADAPGRSSSAARPGRHDRSCVPARSSPCCWT